MTSEEANRKIQDMIRQKTDLDALIRFVKGNCQSFNLTPRTTPNASIARNASARENAMTRGGWGIKRDLSSAMKTRPCATGVIGLTRKGSIS